MKRKIFSILFALVLVVSLSLVTAVPVAAADLAVPGSYATIQDAIDAASPGDTIIVANGTYTEDLTVNKANLTIKSVTGSANTTIQLITGVGIDIQGGASGFTLGGASGEGFTITPHATNTTFDIQLANAPSGVEISHNTIDTTGNASMGISIGAAGATGLTVSNNIFTADSTDGSIWGPNVVNVTVSGNDFQVGGAYAIQFSGVTGTSTIIGNTISGYTGSGGIVISNGAGTSGLTISGNIISSCSNGIYFAEYCAEGTAADMTTVTISGNTISGSTNDAIKVGNGTHVLASNFVFVNNKISGSSVYGLENQHATEQVTAEKNWWGDATGPDHSSNPHGTGQGGDAVTDDVDFTPWYATATTTPSTEYVSVEHNPIIAVSDTIQGGIDAALAGDTVLVSNGTYAEDLDPGGTHIETSGLTVKSVNGKAVTTIQLVDGVGVDLGGGADNFTLGGASGEGFTILSGGGTTFNIQLANAPSGVEISYNTINTTGNASQGISIGAAGSTGLTISNNTFIAEVGDLSIWGPEMVNVTVSGNTFTGPGSVTSGWAIQFAGVTGTSTISGNTITGYGGGIAITNGEGTSGLTISGNTISGCAKGIGFLEYVQSGHTAGNMTTVTVTQNTLSNNTVGLKVYDGAHVLASNFTINYNDISGNTTYGLENAHSSQQVTAEKNWWGNISGPEQVTTNPGGLGDEVSDNVDYQPWLTRVFQTVLDDNITYFGEAIVNLDTGWNIFSTPIALDPACDTWGEYIALGDGLSIHGTSPTYAFNSATQSWVPIYSNYQLKPCEAIYVRMADSDIAPILYSPLISVPSTQLYSGWNLVGLANLADMSALDALASVYNVIGDLSGYSLAVSPSIGNQNAWIYIRNAGGPPNMQVTKGYWVFMINPGTLAGFTFTPMSLP